MSDNADAFRLDRDGLPLLLTWCGGLIAHQVARGDDRGGFLCPAQGRVPGRCADAVYPLLAAHRRTGEGRYLRAAIDVFDWAERHVAQQDGSWLNEVDSPWKGTTTFGTIALAEALRHDGGALPLEVRSRWTDRLHAAADWLLTSITPETGDVNYPLSTSAALALATAVLSDGRYARRARELARVALDHRTVGDLLWGEGDRGPNDASPRGLRPIDVAYNVEESLPNLATYASLTGDAEVEAFVVRSLRAHLAFLLPDGAWDAGWASRQYKWCYWGSATCDGAAAAFQMLRAHDARFADAAARNLSLLRRCTHDGLVHGGPGLRGRGLPPLLHHTFVRAKGLAAALDARGNHTATFAAPDVDDVLREWPEAGIVRFARGEWRGSITANDIPQSAKRNGQPSGGALSLLWHASVGPICVASMNDYARFEGPNMQSPRRAADVECLTPRLEGWRGDRRLSNVYERHAILTCKRDHEHFAVDARGSLCDRDGAGDEADAYRLRYSVDAETFTLVARVQRGEATLVLPIVASGNDPVRRSADGVVDIERSDATLYVHVAGGRIACDVDSRVFNYVPGIEAVVLRVPMPPATEVTVTIRVTRR